MTFCNKFVEIICFMIVIFCTCDRVGSYEFLYMNRLESSILFKRFNFEACNVCKTLMRESHSLSVDVKIITNVGGLSCQSLQIFFFITFQNNQMNYANPPNHKNLSMI